jgi:ectoine hydroxylase-related dioxygenase (phytanoyl-CoA dioxygenase family)
MTAPLTDAQRTQFQRDGYVVLRGLFSRDDLAAADRETHALLDREDLKDRNNLRVRWQYHYETGDPVFELFDPVVDLSPGVRALADDARLRAVIEDLLGDRVHLFKDKLIYKPAGAGGYPLHQDFIAWPGFPESFTTAVIAIDGATEENGRIEVFPGTHAKGCLAERDGNFHILDDEVLGGVAPVALDLAPGDVAIYGAFMPHRSEINRTDASRRHLLISYNADGDGGAQRDAHYEAFHQYLRMMYGMMGMGDLFFR